MPFDYILLWPLFLLNSSLVSKSLLNYVQIQQNSFIKLVSETPHKVRLWSFFQNLFFLNFPDLYALKVCIFAYKCKANKLPPYFDKNFTEVLTFIDIKPLVFEVIFLTRVEKSQF